MRMVAKPREFMRMLGRVLRVAMCGVAVVSMFAGAADARGAGGAKAYWPQWRGAGRAHVATDKELLQEWPEGGPPLGWTGNKLGDGYSSVVIEDGRIYTTGDRKDGEYLISLSDANGKEIWSKRIGDAWKDGGARSTPAAGAGSRERGAGSKKSKQLVYALTPVGDLVCLSARDGTPVWQKNLKKDFGGKMMSGWGYSESPLIDGERIVCTPGA